MAELSKLFLEAGFTDVSTYINSGNVVFSARETDTALIVSAIEHRLLKKFGFEVKVIVVGLSELRRLVSMCPFDEKKLKDREKIYITLLSEKPEKRDISEIGKVDSREDEYMIAGKAIYLLVKNGYTKTVMNNSFLEKKLRSVATTRNINTLRKIAEIGEKLS